MTWIQTISPANAGGKLADLYRRIAGKNGQVDNILQAHSLRPHSLQGHMALYKAVLHHTGNKLPKRTLELIGVWVSSLNECQYCVDHHFAGFAKLVGDDDTCRRIKVALLSHKWQGEFSEAEIAMLQYAEALTMAPQAMADEALQHMRAAGLSDGEILEVNQVVAYFNYANRTVLGLGVHTDGEVLGTSPNNSADENDWQHRHASEDNEAGTASEAKPKPKNVGKYSLRAVAPYKPAVRSGYKTLHGQAMQAGNHIRSGSPLFDVFFRLSAGMCIGCGIGMILYFGPGTEVQIERYFPNHPLTTGAAFGFFASVPINILLFIWHQLRVSQARKSRSAEPTMPRYIGRPAIAITAAITFTILWLAESNMF